METMKAIAARHSTRDFDSRQIEPEKLTAILHAGCAAPVGRALYHTLHMTVVQKQDWIQRLSAAMQPEASRPGDPLYGAPTFIIISSKKPLDDALREFNAACIIENMCIAAADMGVGSVIQYFGNRILLKQPELLAELELPENCVPVLSVCLGYAKEPAPAKVFSQTIELNFLK